MYNYLGIKCATLRLMYILTLPFLNEERESFPGPRPPITKHMLCDKCCDGGGDIEEV